MEGLALGQYLPMESAIHRLDPRTKFLSVMFVMLAVVCAGWAGMALVAVLVGAGIILARIPAGVLWRQVRLLGLIISLTILIQILFTPGNPLFLMGPVIITEQGLTAGLDLFIRLVLIIAAGIILTSTTSPLNLASGIEVLLRPIGRLGVPVHEIVMAVTIAIGFVPIILDEARAIVTAQISRGAGFRGPGLARRAGAVVSLMVPLMTGVFRRSDDLAAAMEARCYQGGAGRTRMRVMSYTRADGVCLTLSGASLVAAVIIRITTAL